ncbi:MAG: hypothetical protein H7Y20_06390 [Bryobacteraceae bacterium]|nr:hypothetical protein [Bryobacteraceae bacterium]
MAVVGIRGEFRPTYTSLPIGDPEELTIFLCLSNELFPDCGFDRSARTVTRVRGNFDPERSDAIFEILVPVLRVLPYLNRLIDRTTPPDVSVLRELALSILATPCLA